MEFSNNHFTSQKIAACSKQTLVAPHYIVFPLLCPKREYEWIPMWKCEILQSVSGYAELDCVFKTNFPNEEEETWIIDRYESGELIQFVRYSHSKIIRYCIKLAANHNNTTTALWQQSIISLNSEGNRLIKNFSYDNFKKEIKMLEKMLNHYLSTGEMLQNSEL